MSTKHTPGPWELAYCKDATGRRVPSYIFADKHNVAFAYEAQAEVGEANANLIAAAPDLLEACEGLVGLLDCDDEVVVGCHCTEADDMPIACCWCKAKAAITKAKGGAA